MFIAWGPIERILHPSGGDMFRPVNLYQRRFKQTFAFVDVGDGNCAPRATALNMSSPVVKGPGVAPSAINISPRRGEERTSSSPGIFLLFGCGFAALRLCG
jgi:hypothetical protein